MNDDDNNNNNNKRENKWFEIEMYNKIVKNERRDATKWKTPGKKGRFFELAVRRNTIAFKLHLVCNEPT